VVLFLPQPPGDTICGGDHGNNRYVIDLDPQSGWLPCAVVTALPAPLPEPFSEIELLSFVGLGPSGSVWMAESTAFPDTPLAVKFLDGYPELHRRDVRERFLEEAVAAKRINSSFLVPTLEVLDLHEHCAHGWAPVALLSWLQEPSLQRVLDDLKAAGQSLPDQSASALVRGVQQGLRELHIAYELVHRDVKPANVLLRLPGERPYRGPESLEGVRAMLADFTTTCRAGQRPLMSAVRTRGEEPPLSPGTETLDSLGAPATDEEDWRGFLDIVAAVAEVADHEFRRKVETQLPAGLAAQQVAEALCARLFPEEPQTQTQAFPDLVPSEERGHWRQAPTGSGAETPWPGAAPVAQDSASLIEVPGYQVVKLLGRGGMGAVYEAVHLQLRRTVALKVLPPAYYSPHAVDRLHVEARAISLLDHPNIVRVYDVGVIRDGLPYIAMELLPGGSLKEWLSQPRTLQERTKLVRELAVAVAFAHDKGVIHRDLKPANVLLAADGTPKVIDFGLAKLLDRDGGLTQSGHWMGTPGYMAPEQARAGSSAISTRADIYGLGGVLYWLLTGRAPFVAATVAETLNQVREQEPVPPRVLVPNLPRDLDAICLKCLRKNPQDRYAGARELADDLQRFLDAAPIRARPVPRWERTARWARRNPAHAAFLACAVIVTFLIIVNLAVATVLWQRQVQASKKQAEDEALGRLIDAAQFALDQGQLAEARARFDQALKAAPPEQGPALEVRRLRCLFAHGHWDELRAELDRLSDRDDLSDRLRAEVLLHRGDVDLCDPAPDQQESARRLIRAALEVPDGLASADAAYARGLLDESTFDAVRHFEEALAREPHHLRANAALLMELVLSGQFEPARRQAERMAATFPDEPVPPLALALMATLQEDGAARDRQLTELRRLVADPALMAGLEAAFTALDEAIRATHDRHGSKQATGWMVSPALFSQVRQGVNPLGGKDISAVIGIAVPILNRPARMIEDLAQAYLRLVLGDATGAAALLAAAEKKYPESLLRLIDADAHLSLATALEHQGDRNGCFRESRRAYELAEEAAEAPTLMPFGPYRHNADWFCLLVEVSWGAQQRADTARLAAAALSPPFTHPLATVATLAAGEERLRTYPVRKDRRHLLRVVANSGAHDEARSELLPRLLDYFATDDARLLLADWADDAPKDPVPFRLRANLELARENFAEAARWAEKGLAGSPDDAELLKLRDRAAASRRTIPQQGKPIGPP
jgi:serine/threonine protein kinase